MDFKWIGFLIEWILNELDHKKNESNHKKWIFCSPLVERVFLSNFMILVTIFLLSNVFDICLYI